MESKNQWITENYDNIQQWARNAAQQNGDAEDLASYAMLTFLEHPKAEELVAKGHARWFIVRIMLNSSRGQKSEYYRLYRPKHDQIADDYEQAESEDYDKDIDTVTEWIHGILEDLKHSDMEDWYRATIFELCSKQDKLNFSKLSRELLIPRTSISNAYYECIEIIKNKIQLYGNTYSNFSDSLRNYINTRN